MEQTHKGCDLSYKKNFCLPANHRAKYSRKQAGKSRPHLSSSLKWAIPQDKKQLQVRRQMWASSNVGEISPVFFFCGMIHEWFEGALQCGRDFARFVLWKRVSGSIIWVKLINVGEASPGGVFASMFVKWASRMWARFRQSCLNGVDKCGRGQASPACLRNELHECGRGFVSLFMKLDGMSDKDLTY